jgi:hypothetical protein
MRTAIIIGRKHGQKALEVVSGPEVPIVEQKELFKDFQRIHANDDYEHVELWISDAGKVKDRTLVTQKRAVELADAKAKAEADLKARVAAAAKAHKEAAANEAKALAESRAKADAKANEHKAKVVKSFAKPQAESTDAKAKAEADTNKNKIKKHEK